MHPVSMKKIDIIAASLLVPVCLWVFYEAQTWPQLPDMGDPRWIPCGVAACLLVATGLLMIKALQGDSLSLESRLEGKDRGRVIWIAVLTGAYVVLLERIGFIAITIPYLFGFGVVLGERRWMWLTIFAVIMPVAIYLLFAATLNVPLPRGIFL